MSILMHPIRATRIGLTLWMVDWDLNCTRSYIRALKRSKRFSPYSMSNLVAREEELTIQQALLEIELESL